MRILLILFLFVMLITVNFAGNYYDDDYSDDYDSFLIDATKDTPMNCCCAATALLFIPLGYFLLKR